MHVCGIFGFIDFSIKNSKMKNVETLKDMSKILEHRGPDDCGVWQDEGYIMNLGHRRLSILELSKLGAQPMLSNDQRYVIVFNGEIYNFQELKKDIVVAKAYNFKGQSDTEVILAALELWGIQQTVQKLVGMYAISIFDTVERALYLIKDRMGEKPLYYGWSKDQFIFASELKAFKKHRSFTNEIDRNALRLYFKYNYIPTPNTIYKDIYKLIPGSILRIDLNNNKQSIEKYWELDTHEKPHIKDKAENIDLLENLLKASIRRQMLASDVPIGAFLSGGVDSSTIVAIMQSLTPQPINTFSIGFNHKTYNEANYAKNVADYLRTNHTELYLSAKDAYSIVPDLPIFYDEPFADSSQIPTFLVSKLAKQHVTVVLSGDGGDELFGGYERYTIINNLVNKLEAVPSFIKKNSSSFIKKVAENKYSKHLHSLSPKFIDRLYRSGELLNIHQSNDLYDYFLSSWKDTEDLVIDSELQNNSFIKGNDSTGYFHRSNFLEWMMYVDSQMYLPDDILVKVDRASMANSLESRVPMLDKSIVEFAHSLPLEYKIRDNTQKWILKQVMYRYLPKRLMDRPKKGFGVPIGQWLQGPLKDWAEELLDENLLKQQGYLNVNLVRKRWEEHKAGARNWQSQLWGVLMFQAWLKNQ